MKTLSRMIAGLLVVVWISGCGDKHATNIDGAKPAESTKPPSGAAPVSQVQQTMAIGQVVEQAASQSDSKAGRRAAASIDKINALKKSEE